MNLGESESVVGHQLRDEGLSGEERCIRPQTEQLKNIHLERGCQPKLSENCLIQGKSVSAKGTSCPTCGQNFGCIDASVCFSVRTLNVLKLLGLLRLNRISKPRTRSRSRGFSSMIFQHLSWASEPMQLFPSRGSKLTASAPPPSAGAGSEQPRTTQLLLQDALFRVCFTIQGFSHQYRLYLLYSQLIHLLFSGKKEASGVSYFMLP